MGGGRLTKQQLSREEEASIGEEKEVRREDQEKINRFSRLHSREKGLEQELQTKQKDKEDLEEISNELELADEDEKVQCVLDAHQVLAIFVQLTRPVQIQDRRFILLPATARVSILRLESAQRSGPSESCSSARNTCCTTITGFTCETGTNDHSKGDPGHNEVTARRGTATRISWMLARHVHLPRKRRLGIVVYVVNICLKGLQTVHLYHLRCADIRCAAVPLSSMTPPAKV
nr:prefoldin subunit 4 [Quercus suber]